jgi:adenine phosphoribosyltransferase
MSHFAESWLLTSVMVLAIGDWCFFGRMAVNLTEFIRDVPDFPKPGILFRDMTPLLSAPKAFQYVIQQFADRFRGARPTAIMATESRGFIFGAPLALELGAAFVPVRKPGKLPRQTFKFEYDLEYGSDALEVHRDAVSSESRVLLIDDLLATGGTIEACMKLAEQCQATIVGCGFVVELAFLQGRNRLKDYDIFSLIQYEGET